MWDAVAQRLERRTVRRGSSLPNAVSFRPFVRKRLNTVGAFYLVSLPGEVKCPTRGVNVRPVVYSHRGGLCL